MSFPYDGPDALHDDVIEALKRVVDPEVALSIVDVGLIYGVTIADDVATVKLTMTTPACPVADVIVDDIGRELERVLPTHCTIDVDLVWEPPWTPERMSADARRFMGW
ncbi:metal-sulfur cluster assembly factor [Aquabacterium humicola]|uniref:metal-sulfur cluster assembly factor n=1 Tax=Aquabacterium humicola TaxID=3237377 RepID=UPI0025439A78|nr:metal-sulfur cluster assembly factor [Rubrivivax pictus]